MEQKIRKNGNVTVTVERKDDHDGYQNIADFTAQYAEKPDYDGYSYYRREDVMFCPDSTWRDRRGRFVSEPKDWSENYGRGYSREYAWITFPNGIGVDCLKYAYQNADRLRAYERGDWYPLGIQATVTVDGVDVADWAVWGYESDMDDREFRSIEREIEREAIAQARQWFNSRKVA